jgi:hypothetical protein
MDRTARRLYFAGALVVFLIALPLVYASTSGLRFTGRRLRVVARGSLVIVSEPSGARVTINGREYPDRTPLRASALPAGRYTIRLDRAGFAPWEKQLVVEPGRATLALSVPLFRARPKLERLGLTPDQVSLDPTGRFLIFVDAVGLGILRRRDQTIERLETTPPWDEITWASDGRRAIIGTAGDFRLLTVGLPSRLRALPTALDIAFDPLDADSVLLATISGVERYSVVSQYLDAVGTGPAVEVAASGHTLAWRAPDGSLKLSTRAATGVIAGPARDLGSITGNLSVLPHSKRIVLAGGVEVIDLTGGNRIPLLGVSTILPHDSPDGEWLLGQTRHEIWAVRFADQQRELLSRTEATVTGATFVASGRAVAAGSDRVIRAVELDGRHTRNAPVLFRGDATVIGADATGRVILLAHGETAGLIALTVQ